VTRPARRRSSPRTPRRLALAALLAAACPGREGDILVAPAAPDAAAPTAACPPVARTILVLDREGRLASYDPRTDLLRERASLAASVPSTDCGASSVALALDRQGAAWIAGCDGDLLKCDPDSGLCAGGWSSAPLPRALRMAWAAEPGGAQALFLAVAPATVPPFPTPPPESTLVRFPRLGQPVGTLAGWPSLTGTADRLWALFPGDPRRGTPARLAALDLASGREVEQRDTAGVLLGPIPALIAASGEDVWVFQGVGSLTVVQRMGGGGQGSDLTRAITRRIVAVASSTCGP
jgi:hypothetical protein